MRSITEYVDALEPKIGALRAILEAPDQSF